MRGSHALTGHTSRPCPGPVTGDPTCCRALSGVSGCELCPRKCAAEGRGAELGPGLSPGAGPSVWEGPRPAALGFGTKADDRVPNDGKHTGPEDQEPFYCKTVLPKARARAWRAVVPMRAFARQCAARGRLGTAHRGEGGWPAVLAARAAVAEAEPARQAVGRGRRQLPGAVVFLRV